MKKIIQGILFILIVIASFACNEKIAEEKGDKKIDSKNQRVIHVEFDLPGDDIGSPEYVNILNKIVTSINNNDVGKIASFGFGIGSMEISLIIEDEESISKVKKILIDNYPEAKYIIKQKN